MADEEGPVLHPDQNPNQNANQNLNQNPNQVPNQNHQNPLPHLNYFMPNAPIAPEAL